MGGRQRVDCTRDGKHAGISCRDGGRHHRSQSRPKRRCGKPRSVFALSCNSHSTCTGRATRSIASFARSSPKALPTRRRQAPRSVRRAGKCPTWSLTQRPGASTGRRSMPTCRSVISSTRGLRPTAESATSPCRGCRYLTRRGASSATAASAGTSPIASGPRRRCVRARSVGEPCSRPLRSASQHSILSAEGI